MIKNIFLSSLLGLCSITFGATGTTTLPWWLKNSTSNYTTITLTNISDEDVQVFIRLYEDDGTLYLESTEAGTNLSIEYNFSGDPTLSTGATLEPGTMGQLRIINAGSTKRGYAIIEWDSPSNNNTSLIGVSNQVTINPGSVIDSNYILINNGSPF